MINKKLFATSLVLTWILGSVIQVISNSMLGFPVFLLYLLLTLLFSLLVGYVNRRV